MSDIDKLRGFAKEIMDCWSDGPGVIDVMDIQDMAVKHGLLLPEMRHSSCETDTNYCSCSEFVTTKEFKAGVECFRKTKLLKGE